jgi:hypothetical protein
VLSRLHLTKRGATLGLVALGIADVVLIALALQAGAGTGGTPQTLPRSTATVTPSSSTGTPSPGESTSAGPTSTSSAMTSVGAGAPAADAAPRGRLLLAAVDADHAWRVHGGSCDTGGATIERTSDGGRTWTRVSSPLRMITRLSASDPDTAFIDGAGEGCTPQERRTDDGGGTWVSGDPSTSWYVVPKHPRSVNGPAVGTSEPCGSDAVQDLVAVRDGARVLCTDGTIRATYSYGREWVDTGKVAKGTDLDAVPGSSRLYATRVGQDGCSGIEVVRVGETNDPVACIDTEADPSAAAFSLTPDGGWLAAGNTVWRSQDRQTWQETAPTP